MAAPAAFPSRFGMASRRRAAVAAAAATATAAVDRRHRGVTTLMYAAQQGDVEQVRRIVKEQPPSLFVRDRTGKSPLHYCSSSGSLRAAQAADYMVMAAPDLVDSRDEDGFTPLHLAVIAGNMQLVTFLLANGADVNTVDNEKHSVVHWATVCGETAALRAVLAAGAPVSTPDVHGGYPLHYAAQMCGGDRDSNLGLQVLQTLLTHSDIQVSVTDGDKRQPLLWAASAGSAKAVLALIRAGAGVEASDKDGLTALHCAASRGHTDCMDTLLTLCGASPDVIDSNGCTALHYAVTLGHADATALLLAHGADPNRQDRKGRTPAHCGCAKGQFETVKLIGSHGANLWLRNARGDLPLHDAAASGRRELVKFLLQMRPSQVNSRNNDGRCPLHMAALNDNSDMCKILLDAGAHINPILRTSKNIFMTPLDCALQRGFRSTAKYLQLHGGVPASRLGDPRNQSLNLQIRDDITFWGDTSSGSERENGEEEKTTKRLYKKKVSQKFERKRVSSSEKETRSKSGKLEGKVKRSAKRHSEKSGELRSSSKLESAASSKRSSSSIKMPSSTRVDYNNEIIINGRTEINIHETRDISIDKENKPVDIIETVVTKDVSATVEKEQRPRSAKYSKVRDRSAKSNAEQEISRATRGTVMSPESLVERDAQEARKQFASRDKGTNTSEETAETVIENKKKGPSKDDTLPEEDTISKDSMEEHVAAKKGFQDQQSVMSYTSEDVDEQKDIVVEAAVHAPPSAKIAEPEKATEDVDQRVKKKKVDQVQPVEEKVGSEAENAETKEVGVVEKPEHVQMKVDKIEAGQEIKNEAQVKSQEDKVDVAPGGVAEEQDHGIVSVKSEQDSGAKPDGSKLMTVDVELSSTSTVELPVETLAEGKIEKEVAGEEDKVEGSDEKPKDLEGKMEDTKVGGGKDSSEVDENEKELQEKTGGDEDNLKQELKEEPDIEQVDVQTDPKLDKNVEEEGLQESKIVEDIGAKHKNGGKGKEKTMTKDKATRGDQKDQKPTTKEKSKAKQKLDEKKKNGKKLKHEDVEAKTSKQKLKIPKDSVELLSSESEENSVSLATEKVHKSFTVLNEEEAKKMEKQIPKRSKKRETLKKERSHSDETKSTTLGRGRDRGRTRSKIPTPLFKTTLSKSDRHLDKLYPESNLDNRVPSLPNIHRLKEPIRSESNMSAPLLASLHSDERDSISDPEETRRSLSKNKRLVKRRSRARESRSAGSDYESSNLIDSGFEPSPRSTRIPRWKNMSDRGVNMSSVTQNIQNNIRRYHLERKIFQQLLELKRHQIRSNQHNEAVLVKRAIDDYHRSCASTVGAGRYIPDDFTFKSFEKFLYEALRKLQKNGVDYMRGLPESSNPLLCTRSTNRCMHATHAYTGVPCAAYLPKMDHHSIPKIGYNSVACKPGSGPGGFLPNINAKKAVTLELSHGTDKQIISLPTDRLDQNKRYYVTFTVKGHEGALADDDSNNNNTKGGAHRHAKSD